MIYPNPSQRPCPIVVWLSLCLSLALTTPAWAEAEAAAPTSEPTVDSASQRHKLVESNMPLTAAEAGEFWPVYDRYQAELYKLLERRKWLITALGENYEEIDEEIARQFTEGYTELQETRLKLLKSHLPKFAKVLPPKKLVRFYQIETKIRAAVDAEIAERIPLVQ